MSDETKERSRKIVSFYCVNKKHMLRDACSQECERGTCLCLDRSQVLLLQNLTEDLIGINLAPDGTLLEDGVLKDVSPCPKQHDPAKRLINCHGYSVGDYESLEQPIQNIVGCFPIIQCVNVKYPIRTRCTVAGLCLFSTQGSELLEAYMRAVVKRLCQEWRDGNLKACRKIGKAAELVFMQIRSLFQKENYLYTVKTLEGNFEQYADVYDECGRYYLRKDVQEVEEKLQEKTEQYEKLPDALSFILFGETGKKDGITYLYHILKKLLKAAGCPLKQTTHKFFKRNLIKKPRHRDYMIVDRWVDALLSAESEEEKDKAYRRIECQLDKAKA